MKRKDKIITLSDDFIVLSDSLEDVFPGNVEVEIIYDYGDLIFKMKLKDKRVIKLVYDVDLDQLMIEKRTLINNDLVFLISKQSRIKEIISKWLDNE